MRKASGSRKPAVRRFATVMAAVGALLVSSGIALMAAPTPATAGSDHTNPGVCQALDSAKIDVSGSHTSLEVSAPAGMLIDQYCVKAGSWIQGDGPEYIDVTPPAATVTIRHSTGKDISHYSLSYTPMPTDAAADVRFTEPSCENGNTVGYVKTTSVNVGSWDASGTWEPGGSVTVTATAAAGHLFAGDPPKATKVFTYEFAEAELNCTAVMPAAPTFVEPTCTTAPAVQLPKTPAAQPPAARAAESIVVGPVKYDVTGSLVAGGTVTVAATLVDQTTTHWAEGARTSWTHTFVVPTGCTAVSPPTTSTQVSPPTTESTTESTTEEAEETTTPTVVQAGLVGTTDTSTRTGLGLTLAGLLLIAGAGSLVLVEGGARKETA